ncbi:MAG TPA: hypothetical protein DHV39_06425 [Verrucomicrobiales bacterium]|nr:hypothetical protein [Verrucomicrobiales bacterium]HCZ03033.1 hypothetical protein [Verrucomicrobiales bacterium]
MPVKVTKHSKIAMSDAHMYGPFAKFWRIPFAQSKIRTIQPPPKNIATSMRLPHRFIKLRIPIA